jgi:enoyl-CoA hydratase
LVDFEQIIAEVSDGVMTITLNRPDRLNAWTAKMAEELMQAFDQADADDDVRAVIMTGAGRGYCAGADLEKGGETFDARARGHAGDAVPRDNGGQFTLRIFNSKKPVIGAINGAAVTGGLELALYCDILIASENARFADTHARVGLLPTWGLSVRLPQKVGIGLARRMSLTGDYLSAQDALRAGLVTEVVAHDDLLPAARTVAASIVGNNAGAVRALLESYHRIDEQQTSAGLRIEAASATQWMRVATGDDIAANRAAVLERGRAQVH